MEVEIEGKNRDRGRKSRWREEVEIIVGVKWQSGEVEIRVK